MRKFLNLSNNIFLVVDGGWSNHPALLLKVVSWLSSFIEQKEKETSVLPAAFCFVNLKHRTTIESFLVRRKRLNLMSVSEKEYILRVKTTMEVYASLPCLCLGRFGF